ERHREDPRGVAERRAPCRHRAAERDDRPPAAGVGVKGLPRYPRQLSARVDDELRRNMLTLRIAGLSWSQMVKWGVALLADVYRAAWIYGQAPPTKTPILKSYIYARYNPDHQGPPWIDEENTTDAEERPEVHREGRRHPDRPAGGSLPALDLPGLGRDEEADLEAEPVADAPDPAVR